MMSESIDITINYIEGFRELVQSARRELDKYHDPVQAAYNLRCIFTDCLAVDNTPDEVLTNLLWTLSRYDADTHKNDILPELVAFEKMLEDLGFPA